MRTSPAGFEVSNASISGRGRTGGLPLYEAKNVPRLITMISKTSIHRLLRRKLASFGIERFFTF